VVKLKTGSMYRGTILELVVGDHVDLRLVSGEVKRFGFADVAFAGPANDAPSPAPPLPPPPPPPPPAPPPAAPATGPQPLVTLESTPAKIHFEATSHDVDFHIRTGEAVVSGMVWTGRGLGGYGGVAHGYDHICTAPCVATLPAGTHRLALSLAGGQPVEAREAITIAGPSTVRGTYVSRQGTRVGGWLLLGGSLVLGTVLMVASLQSHQDCSTQSLTGTCTTEPSIDSGLMTAGVATIIVGPLLSLALILQRDSAQIDVVPFDGALLRMPGASREGAWLAPAAAGAHGLGVRVKF
jgi:hypothetical protein